MKITGTFITIEGIEGVGKTTAVQFIQHYLLQHQREHVITREPGGTAIAEQIRQILLTPNPEDTIVPATELLLMFACRAQHVEKVVLPALQAGKWVVSDRFVDATYAYQGGGRKMNMTQINMLEKWIVGNLQPDLTILLDAPPAIGLARAKHRSPQDRIEQEKIDFFERVRQVYLSRAKQFPERFSVIDATQPLAKVQDELTKNLETIAKRAVR
ncbi:MAG: hypothetical protein ACD_45C00303G0005 [uncultured bacterium]|nr:MAG: hypothetical protein ACD_45C00303G0005 [uncultured bacterium]